jgi:hypothetical protein
VEERERHAVACRVTQQQVVVSEALVGGETPDDVLEVPDALVLFLDGQA